MQIRASVLIRQAEENDWPAIWPIIDAVVSRGDTYVFKPDTPEVVLKEYWLAADKWTYVATDVDRIVGTFWLKANQPGLGSHVANAAYMVAADACGKGVGRQMAHWSLVEARRLGFTAMQFNFVVESNTVAVELWKKIGFEIIGEIPDAFDHVENGLTNALIMYRKL